MRFGDTAGYYAGLVWMRCSNFAQDWLLVRIPVAPIHVPWAKLVVCLLFFFRNMWFVYYS